MRLELINKNTFPVLIGKANMTLTITTYGVLKFSLSLFNLIMSGKKQREHISIAEDADNPKDWYIVHEENTDGYNISKGREIKHRVLVSQIVESLGLNPALNHSFELDKPFLYEGCQCFKIKAESVQSKPVHKKK